MANCYLGCVPYPSFEGVKVMIGDYYEIRRGLSNQFLFYADAVIPFFVRMPRSGEVWEVDSEDLLRSILNNHFREETVASILELKAGATIVLASERF